MGFHMEDIDYEKIGARIRRIRKENHYTQKTLADTLKVTQKHISDVERGETMFSLKQLVKFCDITECSMDYIVLGNSTNNALSGLPDTVIDILNGSNGDKKAILQRYMRMFVELMEYQTF